METDLFVVIYIHPVTHNRYVFRHLKVVGDVLSPVGCFLYTYNLSRFDPFFSLLEAQILSDWLSFIGYSARIVPKSAFDSDLGPLEFRKYFC